MSVTIRIPNQLRNLAGGDKEVVVDATTLRQAINELEQNHPGISSRIIDETGSVRKFINVFVNDEDIRFLKGSETELQPGTTVSIVPAVAGG